ncbi:MAG: hypothetical protein PHY14_02885 [Candidatus Gracilibacteria bacterium]|nr:hypothetical protein [Candidatus Gracilibacteria bacterium]
MELHLDCRLDPEEQEYTEASLDSVMNEIRSKIDIMELAVIKLKMQVDTLPKDSGEYKEYLSSDGIYVADCPRCQVKGGLRIFQCQQTFGCRECNWDGDYSDQMDIFRFLIHCGVIQETFDIDENHKNGISKLFELFPRELAHLAGRDLYQYTYSGDYFAEADKYYPGIKTNYEELDWRIKNVPKRNRVYEILEPLRQERGKLGSIIQSHAIVSKIYARQANIQAILFGKPISEVLGHELEDEFAEGNMKLHPFSDFDSDIDPEEMDDLVAELSETDDYLEDGLNEFYGKSLTEVLGDFEELETDNITTTPNDTTELNHFNFGGLDDDGNWREGDSGVHQEEMTEEQIRLAEELRIAREENPHKLLLDLGGYKDELKVFSQERDTFFESCEYTCVGEKNESLSVGDFGKLVLVYGGEQKKFSVVIGSRKSQSAPPSTIKAAKSKTYTREMPSDVGNHKDINIPSGSERFGGAQYIVLPENTILIGGQSGDYGSVPREIVEKCFESLGYSVFFLDNTEYVSIDDVYRGIRN